MLIKSKKRFLAPSLFLYSIGLFFLYLLYSMQAGSSAVVDQAVFVFLLVNYAAICLLPIYHRVTSASFDLFEPPVWTSFAYGLTFGLLGLPLFSAYVSVNPFLDSYYWMNLSFFYIVLGIAALWVGYNTRLGPWVLTKMRTSLLRLPTGGSSVRLSMTIVLYTIGIAARIYMINNGLYAYLSVRNAAVESLGEVQVLMHLENFCSYALALITISYFSFRTNTKALFSIILFSSEIIFGFISGMKSHVIVPILMVGIIYFYMKRIAPKGILLTMIAVLVFIYPFSIAYRDMINRQALDTTSLTAIISAAPEIVRNAYSGNTIVTIFNFGFEQGASRFSMLESFSLVVKDFSQSGDFWYGKNYIYFPAYIFIPRIIWPNKPVFNMGLWFTQTYINAYAATATAITYPGDFYLNFGLLGVIMGMCLTGIVYKIVYGWLKENFSPRNLFLYIFIFLAITNHEGDFLAIYTGLIKQLIELIMIRFFIFKRVPGDI